MTHHHFYQYKDSFQAWAIDPATGHTGEWSAKVAEPKIWFTAYGVRTSEEKSNLLHDQLQAYIRKVHEMTEKNETWMPREPGISPKEYLVKGWATENGIYSMTPPGDQMDISHILTELVEEKRMVWCHATGQPAPRKTNPKFARFLDDKGKLLPNSHAFVLRDITGKHRVWACSNCNHTAPDQLRAEACCQPNTCDCGAVTLRYALRCEECRKVEWRKDAEIADRKELARITKVILPEEYKGEQVYRSDQYLDLDELPYGEDAEENIVQDEVAFVFACHTYTEMPKLCAHDILLNLTESEELGEELADTVMDMDIEGLQKILDAWTKAQEYKAYFVDDKTAIALNVTKQEMEDAVSEAKTAIAEEKAANEKAIQGLNAKIRRLTHPAPADE